MDNKRSDYPISGIEQYKNYKRRNEEKNSDKKYYSMGEFLAFIKSKGIPIKDNRWNGGCLWVRADTEIADLMAYIIVEGHGFKYSPKCKSFNGHPGWYY